MATLGSMLRDIVDELPRGDSSITAIAQAKLLNAIDFYTTDRFWFNEKQTTLTTTPSLAYYSWPADLLEIDSVLATESAGTKYELTPITYQEMNAFDAGNSYGQPCWYSTYNKQFRLYPVPDATYTIIVSHQYSPATLSATTDSNAWTVEAEALIRSRALKNLYFRFKDKENAAFYQEIEAQEYERLKRQTDKLLSTNTISGSGF